MAYVLHPDATLEEIAGEALTLERMHEIVGGYIEIVGLGGTRRDRLVLIVNDNGLREGLALNPVATVMYQEATHTGHPVVGTVIVCRCLDGGLDTERFV